MSSETTDIEDIKELELTSDVKTHLKAGWKLKPYTSNPAGVDRVITLNSGKESQTEVLQRCLVYIMILPKGVTPRVQPETKEREDWKPAFKEEQVFQSKEQAAQPIATSPATLPGSTALQSPHVTEPLKQFTPTIEERLKNLPFEHSRWAAAGPDDYSLVPFKVPNDIAEWLGKFPKGTWSDDTFTYSLTRARDGDGFWLNRKKKVKSD